MHQKKTVEIRNFSALTAAVPAQLYAALQKEVGNDFNVSETWSSWISQPGYPVLNVHIASDRQQVQITQKRFLRSNPNHQLKTLWKIPLSYASNKENTDFSQAKPFALLSDQSMQIDLNEPIDWIIFNVQQTGNEFQLIKIAIISFAFALNHFVIGYYHVNYDDENWSAISNLLHKSHSAVNVLNRAQVCASQCSIILRILRSIPHT